MCAGLTLLQLSNDVYRAKRTSLSQLRKPLFSLPRLARQDQLRIGRSGSSGERSRFQTGSSPSLISLISTLSAACAVFFTRAETTYPGITTSKTFACRSRITLRPQLFRSFPFLPLALGGAQTTRAVCPRAYISPPPPLFFLALK